MGVKHFSIYVLVTLAGSLAQETQSGPRKPSHANLWAGAHVAQSNLEFSTLTPDLQVAGLLGITKGPWSCNLEYSTQNHQDNSSAHTREEVDLDRLALTLAFSALPKLALQVGLGRTWFCRQTMNPNYQNQPAPMEKQLTSFHIEASVPRGKKVSPYLRLTNHGSVGRGFLTEDLSSIDVGVRLHLALRKWRCS